jgi:hypothetical protein
VQPLAAAAAQAQPLGLAGEVLHGVPPFRRQLEEPPDERAEEIIEALKITSPPVDPLAIVRSEAPLLLAIGDDFKNRFDGELRYHPKKNRFILFYNTKYDVGRTGLHPRTRFSIAHELGHYFIERHHSYLFHRGRPHPSKGEFADERQIEREADTFAASLLMPSRMMGRLLDGEPTFAKVRRLADTFQTSVVSTAIRCVQLSDFPCALAAVRDSSVAWMVASQPLIKGGCYPRSKLPLASRTSRERWLTFQAGGDPAGSKDALVEHWFETYEREGLDDIVLSEEYQAVRSMGTMLVLLTLDEDDLFPADEEEGDEES